MASSKRDRQRENRNMSMGSGLGGVAVPEHIARAIAQQQGQGPPHDEQRRNLAVQLAINSFSTADEGKRTCSNDELAERTKVIDALIAGTHEVFKRDEDDDTSNVIPDLGALST